MQVVHQGQKILATTTQDRCMTLTMKTTCRVCGSNSIGSQASQVLALNSQSKKPNPTHSTQTPHKMIFVVFRVFHLCLFENHEHRTPFLRTMRPTLYQESRPRFNSNQSFLLVQKKLPRKMLFYLAINLVSNSDNFGFILQPINASHHQTSCYSKPHMP